MKRSVFLPIVLCVLLILPVFAAESAEQPDFGTLTAAEQAVFSDILAAAEEDCDTVVTDGIISHTRILTHLGLHYGTTRDLSTLYRADGSVLHLDLQRFRAMEDCRIAMEARVSEAVKHMKTGSDRAVMRRIAVYVADTMTYEQGKTMCGDYAMLFYKLATKLGLEAYLCFGHTEEGFHAWNMVRLHGEPRYCDPTWFDSLRHGSTAFGTIGPAARYLCSRDCWGRTAVLNDKWAGYRAEAPSPNSAYTERSNAVSESILVAILSLLGTLGGSLFGILAANKVTVYRLSQLEEKVSKHNKLVERTYILEGQMQECIHDIRDLKDTVRRKQPT